MAYDLAGVSGGNFLFPTCDEAQRRADAYGAEAADAQRHVDRGELPAWSGFIRERANFDRFFAQQRADRVCGRAR